MNGWAVFGGVAGSALVLTFLVWRKKQELEARAELVSAGSELTEDEAARAVAELRSDLGDYGQRYTEVVAEQTADRYLAQIYGLTPERIESMSRLSSILG